MAWGASDLSARWFTDMAADLAMLCLAVNEREAALGVTEGHFTYNGGTKARPSAADLSGMPLHGSFAGTLKQVQTATLALIDRSSWPLHPVWFARTTSSGSTRYTQASLESAIGLGTFPTTPEITNGNDWERIRRALDKLLYFDVAIQPTDTPTNTEWQLKYAAWDGYGDPSDKPWDDCVAESFDSFSSYRWDIHAYVMWVVNSAANAQIHDNISIIFPSSAFAGIASNAKLYYYKWQSSSSKLSLDVDVDLAGNTVTFTSAGPDGGTYGNVSVTTPSLSADQTYTCSIDTTPPSGSPWQYGGYGASGMIQLRIERPNIWGWPSGSLAWPLEFRLDISGECTDQA